MNAKTPFDPLHDELPKKEWVVYKFPIKGGGLIRAAMHVELFYKAVPWSTIEGKIIS